METLSLIYYCKVGLGVVAALICVAGWALTDSLFSNVFQGASFAIIFYIITYYILKMKFVAKVDKPSKLLTTGIGVYFMTWIVSWVLILSIVLSFTAPVAVFGYSPNHPVVGQTVTFDASASYDPNGRVTSYSWIFGDNQGLTGSNSTVTHTYAAAGNYTVLLYVVGNDGLVSPARSVVVEIK